MSGLVLKLAPKERVLINGAVIENGDRRGRLSIVSPNVNILRLKDAIHPNEATTPVRRVIYLAQLILSGDAEHGKTREKLLLGIEQLSQAMTDSDSRRQLADATSAVIEGNAYQCMKSLKSLLPREDRMLSAKLA